MAAALSSSRGRGDTGAGASGIRGAKGGAPSGRPSAATWMPKVSSSRGRGDPGLGPSGVGGSGPGLSSGYPVSASLMADDLRLTLQARAQRTATSESESSSQSVEIDDASLEPSGTVVSSVGARDWTEFPGVSPPPSAEMEVEDPELYGPFGSGLRTPTRRDVSVEEVRQQSGLRSVFPGLIAAAAAACGIDLPVPPPGPVPDGMVGEFFREDPRSAGREVLCPRFPPFDPYVRKGHEGVANIRGVARAYLPFTRVEGRLEGMRTGVPRLDRPLASVLCPDTMWRPDLKPSPKGKLETKMAELADKAYMNAAQSAAAGNNIALLAAFISKVSAGKAVLEPGDSETLAQASGAILHLTQLQAVAAGKAMALATMVHRHLWLEQSSLEDSRKIPLLKAPLSEEGLFGSSIEEVAAACRVMEEERS